MSIKTPFFIVNPKSYLYGEELIKLAKEADKFAEKYNVTTFFTAPYTELSKLTNICKNLIITAQHMDKVIDKNAMGKLSLDALIYNDVKAVVLNHADSPLTLGEIQTLIMETKKNDIHTIVCANSVQEAQAVALLDPTIVLAEPTELIGGKSISSEEYVHKTIKAIKEINPNVLVEQGAGIRSDEDVEKLLKLGADGIGVTSGILKADTPSKVMESMIKMVATFKEEN